MRVAGVLIVSLVLVAQSAAAPPRYTRCGTKAEQARAIVFRAADGQRLVGLALGKGPRGVVLAHQFRSNLCAWLPVARTLAKRGYRVLAFDFRAPGTGDSADLDVAAAARALLGRGATSVVLVGASMGGTASLAAAPSLGAKVAGVVSFSGPAVFAGMDATAAIAALTPRILLVVGENDEPFAADAVTLRDAATGGTTRLEVLAGSSHGVSLARGAGLALLLGFLGAG